MTWPIHRRYVAAWTGEIDRVPFARTNPRMRFRGCSIDHGGVRTPPVIERLGCARQPVAA